MFQIRRVLVVLVAASVLKADGGSKYYTDENRPYEFGFNIEGEQHRHEKKDENGLIEGEFGFITADGVYHVTVYATDENGNFKILSMKNIRTKPYPTTAQRKGNSIPFPPSNQQTNAERQKFSDPTNSCASCSVPTTQPPRPAQNPAYNELEVPRQPEYAQAGNPTQPGDSNQHQYPSQSDNPAQPEYPSQPEYPTQPEYPSQPEYPAQPQYPSQSNYASNPDYQSQPEYSPQPQYPTQNNPQENYYGNSPADGNPGEPQQYPGEPQAPVAEYPERNPKQYTPGQDKPVLISAQMKFADPNTDIYAKAPGERDGLPNGLHKNDMELLLYTFNYTVAFHGHYEEGYQNGYKKGYYFVTGRNGVRTRVDYEADDKGFRPKITQEVLDLLSEDVPKEETEKDAKYGLRGYEFKWLYYPVESQQQR